MFKMTNKPRDHVFFNMKLHGNSKPKPQIQISSVGQSENELRFKKDYGFLLVKNKELSDVD